MVHLLRRYQQTLMIMVTVLVIIAFVALYNTSRFMDRTGGDHVGVIYGKPVTMAQANKLVRKFDLVETWMDRLGLRDMLVSLAVRPQDAKDNFLWNDLVLKHESDVLGIRPTDDEVFTAIQAMPLFQTRGAYDSNIFNNFVASELGKRGLTIPDLEDVVRDELRVRRIKTVLGAGAPASDSEIRAAFNQMYQKVDASVVRLKIEDFLAAVQIPDEELKKSFEQRTGTLKTEELRKVKYVAFILPTTDKPLDGPARALELQKFQKAADDFIVAMTEKGAKFEDVAAKANAKVEETAEFSQSKPPADLAGASEFASKAFELSMEQPNSDPVGSNRGYYVLQLAGITPPRPLTFEEAKGNLTEELKREKAQEALNLKATEIRNKIVAETKAGKPFAEAAVAAGAKVEPFPPFSPEDGAMGRFSELPDSSAVMQMAKQLNEGEVSTFMPMEKGGLLVHLDKREPIDEAKFLAEKPRVGEQVSDLKRSILFQEWIKHRRASAQKKAGSA